MVDEAKQQLMDKATRLLDKLQITDGRVKQSMAFMLIGMKMVHYGAARLAAHTADKTDTVELREAVMELAMKRMRDLSMEGFNSKILVENLRMLDQILISDLKDEKERDKQRRNTELKLGVPLPFKHLNRLLNGGLKPGKLVMVYGEAEPVFTTIAGIYRHLVKQKVPITHFGTAVKSKMPDVPGVTNVPGAFWRAQGATLNKMNDVFAVGDGYVVIVDRLEWLTDPDDHKPADKRRQLALKYLAKAARRYKVSVVVGHIYSGEEEKLPAADGVIRLPVCYCILDGEQIMMAGDEMFVEEKDGRLRILGSRDDSSSRLGKSDGGTDGPEQLEESSEDSGKDQGLAGIGGGEEPELPTGEGGDELDADERQGQASGGGGGSEGLD